MPIGRPDWYIVGRSENVSSMDDMGELAVRLGSPLAYDRTGKTILIDTFERLDGHWSEVSVGESATKTLDTTYADYGGNSLYMPLTAGATNYYQVSRILRGWNQARLSVEFAATPKTNRGNLELRCAYNFDGIETRWGFRFNTSTLALSYLSGINTFTEFDSLDNNPLAINYFPTWKLDADLSGGYYTRLRVDSLIVDMSDITLYTRTSSAHPFITINIKLWGNAGGAVDWYLDRVILTEDL